MVAVFWLESSVGESEFDVDSIQRQLEFKVCCGFGVCVFYRPNRTGDFLGYPGFRAVRSAFRHRRTLIRVQLPSLLVGIGIAQWDAMVNHDNRLFGCCLRELPGLEVCGVSTGRSRLSIRRPRRSVYDSALIHLDDGRCAAVWRRPFGRLELVNGTRRLDGNVDPAVRLDDVDYGIHRVGHYEPDSVAGMEVADFDPAVIWSWLRPLFFGNELNRRRLFPTVWILVLEKADSSRVGPG